jgi:hypothetical protein
MKHAQNPYLRMVHLMYPGYVQRIYVESFVTFLLLMWLYCVPMMHM